jgi:rhomboid protease GluP
MIKRFLSDTLDLVLEVLARLGLLRGGSRWWRDRMRRRLSRYGHEWENVRRSVGSSHRMCRECRALVPARERVCPDCGAAMAGVPRGGAGRLASLLSPSLGSASITLVGVIGTIYLACMIASPEPSLWSLPGRLLFDLGAKIGFQFVEFRWWRLVNPIFLHGGLFHIGFNAYALANLGPLIEAWVGARRFLVVFMGTGVFSFVVSAWWSPSMSVGASGALFGLIGFGIAYAYTGGGGSRAVANHLMQWALMGVLLLFIGRIDHAAHAGGFLAGLALGAVVRGRAAPGSLRDRAWTVAAVVAALLPVGGFLLALQAGVGR